MIPLEDKKTCGDCVFAHLVSYGDPWHDIECVEPYIRGFCSRCGKHTYIRPSRCPACFWFVCKDAQHH